MLDSTPFLSLVDDSEMEISSFSNTTSVNASRQDGSRLEKLEREVLNLSRRLEQESQARRKLQEILLETGIKLPAEVSLPEWNHPCSARGGMVVGFPSGAEQSFKIILDDKLVISSFYY